VNRMVKNIMFLEMNVVTTTQIMDENLILLLQQLQKTLVVT